jgi:tetratricopeptide (TPR) repeat protein
MWQWRLARTQQARAESRLSDVLRLADSLLFKANDAIASLPNSTQARMTLVRDALNSLDGFANKDIGSPTLQRELAAAYLKIGDIQGQPYSANVGDSAGALESYSKAVAILESLSAGSPHRSEMELALSNAYDAIGSIRTRALDYDAAVSIHLKALALRSQLAASAPRNSQYQRLIALSCMHIGDPLQYQGKDSSVYYKRAFDILESLAVQNGEDTEGKQERGRASQRLGASLESAGAWLTDRFFYERDGQNAYREAFGYFRKAREIAESLAAADPENRKLRRTVAAAAEDEANLLSDVADYPASLKIHRKALAQFTSLAAMDGANVESSFDIFNAYLGMARAFRKAGEPVEARRLFEKAIQLSSSLHRKDPSNYELTVYLFSAYQDLAALLASTGDLAGAVRNTRLAMVMCQDVHTAWGRQKQLNSMLRMAVLLIRSGDSPRAERLTLDVLSKAKKAADQPGRSGDDLSFYSEVLMTCQPAKLRDLPTALVYARRGIQNTKNPHPADLLNLASALHANHYDSEAIDAFRKALDLVPYRVHDRDPVTIRRAIEHGFASLNSELNQ